jgi:hypothetical protein
VHGSRRLCVVQQLVIVRQLVIVVGVSAVGQQYHLHIVTGLRDSSSLCLGRSSALFLSFLLLPLRVCCRRPSSLLLL